MATGCRLEGWTGPGDGNATGSHVVQMAPVLMGIYLEPNSTEAGLGDTE